MNHIMPWIYRLVMTPIILIGAILLSPFISKIRLGFKMRAQAKHSDFPKGTQPLWFHCSSGEFEYAKAVLREIKYKMPHEKILVTYFTPTYKKNIEKDQNVDFAYPAPLDFPGPMGQFIRYHKPRALLISRTDLWPEMLMQSRIHKVPTLLFSASKPPPQWHQWLNKIYYRWTHSLVNQIFCVSEDDKHNLLDWSPKSKIEVRGDTRYDQVSARLMNPNPVKDQLFEPFAGLTLVCGSTWTEDEKELFDVLSLVKEGLLRVIFAPHEPTPSHIHQLRHSCSDFGVGSALYSQSEAWNSNEVLVIDKVGILAELYMKADVAFVGGSFKSTVHSVMEPLAARVLTFVGPMHRNNREALEFQLVTLTDGLSAVTAVNSGKDLAHHLRHLYQQRELLKSAQADIRSTILKKEGASQHVIEWINQQAGGPHD